MSTKRPKTITVTVDRYIVTLIPAQSRTDYTTRSSGITYWKKLTNAAYSENAWLVSFQDPWDAHMASTSAYTHLVRHDEFNNEWELLKLIGTGLERTQGAIVAIEKTRELALRVEIDTRLCLA